MPVFTRVKTWVSNEVLTASDLNGEFNNLLNNTKPESIEDYSTDVSTMQSTTDPGGVGTESLPTTLAGEIQRLRYKIKQIINGAQWYSTPAGSLGTGGVITAALADDAVTQAKLAARTTATTDGTDPGSGGTASRAGAYSWTSSSPNALANSSITITTNGRPLLLTVNGYCSGSGRGYIYNSTSSAQVGEEIRWGVDSGASAGVNTTEVLPFSLFAIFTGSAGTYTFDLRFGGFAAATTGSLTARLKATEL